MAGHRRQERYITSGYTKSARQQTKEAEALAAGTKRPRRELTQQEAAAAREAARKRNDNVARAAHAAMDAASSTAVDCTVVKAAADGAATAVERGASATEAAAVGAAAAVAATEVARTREARLEWPAEAARRGDAKAMEAALVVLHGELTHERLTHERLTHERYAQAAESAALALLSLAQEDSELLVQLERMTDDGGVLAFFMTPMQSHVRRDVRDRICALQAARQEHREAADLRARQSLPSPKGTPKLNIDTLDPADAQKDEEAAAMAGPLFALSCFGDQACVDTAAMVQACRDGKCPEPVYRFLCDCPEGRRQLEETRKGFRVNVDGLEMPVEMAGHVQRVQLTAHVLMGIGSIRVYGFSTCAELGAIRHWLLQELAEAAEPSPSHQPSPRRVQLPLTELEFYLQIHAVINGVLRIFSEDPASGDQWLKFNLCRESAGDAVLAAHRYFHRGKPTYGACVNVGKPPAPPFDRTSDGSVALGGQLLIRGLEANSDADRRALLMPTRQLGMAAVCDHILMPACGRTPETLHDLLDNAGSHGRFPSVIDPSSPWLFTLTLLTPILYREPGVASGLGVTSHLHRLYQRVTSYPPRSMVDHPIWGSGSFLYPHGGNAGDARYMNETSWSKTAWGNLLRSADSSVAAGEAAPASEVGVAVAAEAAATAAATAPVVGAAATVAPVMVQREGLLLPAPTAMVAPEATAAEADLATAAPALWYYAYGNPGCPRYTESAGPLVTITQAAMTEAEPTDTSGSVDGGGDSDGDSDGGSGRGSGGLTCLIGTDRGSPETT